MGEIGFGAMGSHQPSQIRSTGQVDIMRQQGQMNVGMMNHQQQQ
jgi:hypothetical protein